MRHMAQFGKRASLNAQRMQETIDRFFRRIKESGEVDSVERRLRPLGFESLQEWRSALEEKYGVR